MKSIIPSKRIEKGIFLIRNQKVMIDEHLALLYDVDTKILNKAVKRNLDRFPKDFMFQLTKDEYEVLKFQTGISNEKIGRGGRRYPPYAFTEQGVAMLSTVLNSKRAIHVNIEIMRAFVKLREIMSSHKDIVRKINAMEKKYDYQIKSLFDAIHELMAPSKTKRRKIGFGRN